MKAKIRVGIPRGLLYYKHKVLWTNFIKELGADPIISPETNKEILNNGIKHSIDEGCLSSKIYMGHVDWLRNRVDYVFVPRVASYSKNDQTCVRLFALPDIVENTFYGIKLLKYNLDIQNGKTEKVEFLKLGLKLNKNIFTVISAYKKAKIRQLEYEKGQEARQIKLLENVGKLKILIASHSYNTYDKLIGFPVKHYLEKLNTEVIYADRVSKNNAIKASCKISKSLYWSHNQEILGAVELYKDKIDGIILLTTFPCGPDSLVNDLCIRKIKNIPIAYILIDELQGEAGMHTRLESFVDIISARKGVTRCR
ncbi:MAG: hypothetical protein A2Y24_05575 [Clostridiales bacterium GWE2_32_10]|nr:MAG: hypothetical protein A2Y24_05575 [Clostridiales bacterium GWE2_32_10]HBY20471.1 hypothetical protein [Clostridiales bacterium]